MAAVSETIVREDFELHGFLTRQERKYVGRGKQEKDGIDFFVGTRKRASAHCRSHSF